MSRKTITVKEFAVELAERLNAGKDVNCCKQEILNLVNIVVKRIPAEPIEVEWKD